MTDKFYIPNKIESSGITFDEYSIADLVNAYSSVQKNSFMPTTVFEFIDGKTVEIRNDELGAVNYFAGKYRKEEEILSNVLKTFGNLSI
jgi:hypothetical protein